MACPGKEYEVRKDGIIYKVFIDALSPGSINTRVVHFDPSISQLTSEKQIIGKEKSKKRSSKKPSIIAINTPIPNEVQDQSGNESESQRLIPHVSPETKRNTLTNSPKEENLILTPNVKQTWVG